MQLYCCDGRKVQNHHLKTFRTCFDNNSVEENSGPVTLREDAVLKDCKLLSRVTKFCNVENNENNDKNEFLDFLLPSLSSSSKTKSQKSTSTTNTATATLDFRGLHCASLKTLSFFAIWIEQNISLCYKEYEKFQKQESRNNRLKRHQDMQAQQEHEQVQQQFGGGGAEDRVARVQEENHQWEPVLASRIPERVSFDLITLFPSDAHKKTRMFCREVLLADVLSFPSSSSSAAIWEDISQLHIFANFVGCETLSATVTSLIGLHLRQQSNPYLFGNSEYSIVSASTAVVANKNILIEDLQKERLEKIRNGGSSTTTVAAAAAATAPVVINSNQQQQQQQQQQQNSAVVADKKQLHEAVLWLRKQLGTE